MRTEPSEFEADDPGSEVAHSASSPVRLEPERWLENHGDILWKMAIGRLRNAEEAEEVVQETFLSALAAAATFEGRSSERTWLVSILLRRVADRQRKRYTRAATQTVAMEQEFDDTGHFVRPARELDASPADRTELTKLLDACLEKLPELLWAAFHLREVLGMPVPAVCQELGIEANNLGVRLHRARQQLRLCVERGPGGGEP
jgi:RNA polymerase sigma factor (sigma-70 family)